MTTVLVVDDDLSVAQGYSALLEGLGMQVVGIALTLKGAVALARQEHPDITLADVMLDGSSDGLRLPVELRRAGVSSRVVFMSGFPMLAWVDRARKEGAFGFVDKHGPFTDLHDALRAAMDGRFTFPPERADRVRAPSSREREILLLAAEGLTNRLIAKRLGLSSRTVDSHLQAMYERYEIEGRLDLVMYAMRTGWIDPVIGPDLPVSPGVSRIRSWFRSQIR